MLREMLTDWERNNLADGWAKLDGDHDLKNYPGLHVCTPNQKGSFMKLTHSDRRGGDMV